MKKRIFIMLLCIQGIGLSQETVVEVSKDHTRLLIFPDAIDLTVLGNKYNFTEIPFSGQGSKYGDVVMGLSYNDASLQSEDQTNYTVITKDGAVYDFLLLLSDLPDSGPIKVTKAMATTSVIAQNTKTKTRATTGRWNGNEIITPKKHAFQIDTEPLEEDPIKDSDQEPRPLTEELYVSDRREFVRRKCYYNQFNKEIMTREYSRNGNVLLWLQGVYYDHNETYFHFRLENKETIDFDINFLRTSIVTDYGKSSSVQKTEIDPLYRYKVPQRVLGGTENHFFVVFDKFTLDKHKDLRFQIDELNGNRNITLDVEHSFVNRPKRFKK